MVGGERPETGEARFRRFMEGLREIDREKARKAPASEGQKFTAETGPTRRGPRPPHFDRPAGRLTIGRELDDLRRRALMRDSAASHGRFVET
jgi:hypothetical protein